MRTGVDFLALQCSLRTRRLGLRLHPFFERGDACQQSFALGERGISFGLRLISFFSGRCGGCGRLGASLNNESVGLDRGRGESKFKRVDRERFELMAGLQLYAYMYKKWKSTRFCELILGEEIF